MRTLPVAAILAISTIATLAPQAGYAELSKREFCAAVPYCRIPAKFRNGPYLAKPLLREVSLGQVQKHCGAGGHAAGPFGRTDGLIGCSKFEGANCVVYLPKEVRAISKEIYGLVVQHELAHCRGWKHGH